MMDAGVTFQRVSVHRRKKRMDVLISDWRETLPSTTTEVELIDSRDCNEVHDLILRQEQTAGYCLRIGNTIKIRSTFDILLSDQDIQL